MRRTLPLIALLILAALVVPLPLFVISPGGALPVGERVEFGRPGGEQEELSGQLLLTTVQLSRPTAVEALAAGLDDERAVLSRSTVVPDDVALQEYVEVQRQLFVESTMVASAAGLRAAGYKVAVSGSGAQVVGVLSGGPAEGKLRKGDLITAVEGRDVDLATDVVAATADAGAGEAVTLDVRRGDDPRRVTVELEEVSALGRPAIGVAVRTLDREIDLPFPVDVDQGGIGGPSAGLMLALTVFDLASEEDLTGGRAIAGTGTIDVSGRVGPVGGVEQKVAATADAGASLFLVPEAEAAQARRASGGNLRVIPVATLEDALVALRAGSSG